MDPLDQARGLLARAVMATQEVITLLHDLPLGAVPADVRIRETARDLRARLIHARCVVDETQVCHPNQN